MWRMEYEEADDYQMQDTKEIMKIEQSLEVVPTTNNDV